MKTHKNDSTNSSTNAPEGRYLGSLRKQYHLWAPAGRNENIFNVANDRCRSYAALDQSFHLFLQRSGNYVAKLKNLQEQMIKKMQGLCKEVMKTFK